MKTRLLRVALLSAPLLVASCSKGKEPSPVAEPAAAASASAAPAKPPPPRVGADPVGHPCGILTDAEVESALGGKEFTQRETPGAAGANAECIWSLAGGAGAIDFVLHHPSHKARFEREETLMKRQPLADVGDKAYGDPTSKPGYVDVLAGNDTFMLQLSRKDAPATDAKAGELLQQKAVELARRVVSRMGRG